MQGFPPMMGNMGMNPGGMNMFPSLGASPFMRDPNQFNQRPPQSNTSSLYVGNIEKSVTEPLLFQLFIPFGEISSLRIMKDKYTKVSRGFGFVNYKREEDAKKAQMLMNNSTHFGSEIRVYPKINFHDLPENTNVVVKNLAKTINSKTLQEHCGQFGDIIYCYVKTQGERGRIVSLGYGFVQFANAESAQRCIESLNDKELNGQKVSAELYLPKGMRNGPPATNLYIKQFPDDWNKEKIENFLKEEFGKFGQIESLAAYEDHNLKKLYAFVSFATAEESSKASEEMNGKEIDGSILYVNVAQPKSVRHKQNIKERMNFTNQTNIYIRSLKLDVTEADIKNAFEKYGEITSLCIKQWESNQPGKNLKKQFAFVNFKTPESARNVVQQYKNDDEINKLVETDKNDLYLFFAQNKHQRLQFLKTQHNTKLMKGVPGMGHFGMGMPFPNRNMMRNYNNRFNPMMGFPNPMMMNMGGMMGMQPMGGMPQAGGPPNMRSNPNLPMESLNPAMYMQNFAREGNNMMPMNMQPGFMMNSGNVSQQDLNQSGTNSVSFENNSNMEASTDNIVSKNFRTDAKEFWEHLIVNESSDVQIQTILQNKTDFQKLDDEFKLQILGDLVYDAIQEKDLNPELITRITSMIVDFEVLELEEIIDLLINEESLNERIAEAVDLIQNDEGEEDDEDEDEDKNDEEQNYDNE